MDERIDLRSDTVTRPTAGMLDAMMNADVGDDVFGEDPTINALQDKVAEMFGHEAGLFCPSGTMTNQIAIAVHTQPGDEVICHRDAHVYNYEGGGIARNSLASTRTVDNDRATLSPEEIEPLVHADSDWLARTSLVVAEDTSNRGGGKCYEFDELQALSEYCRDRELTLHLDGARAFNAIVYRRHDPERYGRLFDSVSLCLSKGLGAPVGSVLLGSEEFIRKARRVRKVLGGGMRQAGFLAAAALYAIDHHISRLSEDHKHAGLIAEELQAVSGVAHIVPPETNIVLVDLESEIDVDRLTEELDKAGLRVSKFGPQRLRMVTHLDVDEFDCMRAVEIFKSTVGGA